MTCHVKEFTVTLLTIFTLLLQCLIRCCCFCFSWRSYLPGFLTIYVAACRGIDFDSHHEISYRFTLISFRSQTALGHQKKQKFEQLV